LVECADPQLLDKKKNKKKKKKKLYSVIEKSQIFVFEPNNNEKLSYRRQTTRRILCIMQWLG